MGNLPAVRGRGDLDEAVVDGVIVEDQAPAPLRVVRTVARHGAIRAVARQGAYAGVGGMVVAKRAWESRTTARYERWIRSAEAAGDRDGMLAWEDRLDRFRAGRHARRMDLLALPVKIALALPKILGGLLAVFIAAGVMLAIATGDITEVAAPFLITARICAWAAFAVAVAWGPVLLALPWIVIAALWAVGRHAASPAAVRWKATAAGPDMDVSIDETTIARALDALRIPQISKYLSEGVPLQYLVPCRRDGRGTHTVIRLPAGVTADRIGRRRGDLATGLYRLAKEVWPTTGDEEGIVDLWIADKGALNEGAGPYPLLEDGFTDVFKGLPFGRTLRGDPVKIPVTGRNTIAGGMPEQGKSSSARVVACGYALDITTEIRIYIPDTNFDFEVLKPRCSRYIMGAEDEHIEGILGELEELKDELQARGQLLVDYEIPEVTRELASAGVGLHPMFVLLEEAHVAIQHKKHGKDISGLLCDIVKLDRKRGVHFMVSTQAPTRDSMPRDVTRNCSNGIAFAVGDHVANDALLGQGAYAAGHRATELIPGIDRGTALCKGFSGQRSDIVQVYFLPVARGADQVSPLVGRSLAEMARLERHVPGTSRVRAIESRDLLADLDEALGHDRVRLADVPALLRDLAPAWTPYRSLTGVQLKDLLDDAGVRTTNVGNVPRIDPADLRRVLADRPA